ncbi:MAG TPA: uridine kinase [Candidatus Acidoferrales bacterium]|nr:uridine kinase [Bryobacteraceae bacterium]HTS65287.1 uridine kinase [Candidatus Acidoferrales bacterium]
MRAHIIGIAGPSSSGKTELARQLAMRLPGTSIVSLDSYYRGMEEIPLETRKRVNFDHPDALDWELLHEHLVAIAAGRPFEEPVYSFAGYARTSETRGIEPSRYLIVEGLFVLYWPELRAMLDTKVYVQTDPGVCFHRRLTRDVAERGRTPESVIEQYEKTVRPSAEWFVNPTQKYADLTVSGEEPFDRSTSAVLAALHRASAVAGGR